MMLCMLVGVMAVVTKNARPLGSTLGLAGDDRPRAPSGFALQRGATDYARERARRTARGISYISLAQTEEGFRETVGHEGCFAGLGYEQAVDATTRVILDQTREDPRCH